MEVNVVVLVLCLKTIVAYGHAPNPQHFFGTANSYYNAASNSRNVFGNTKFYNQYGLGEASNLKRNHHYSGQFSNTEGLAEFGTNPHANYFVPKHSGYFHQNHKDYANTIREQTTKNLAAIQEAVVKQNQEIQDRIIQNLNHYNAQNRFATYVNPYVQAEALRNQEHITSSATAKQSPGVYPIIRTNDFPSTRLPTIPSEQPYAIASTSNLFNEYEKPVSQSTSSAETSAFASATNDEKKLKPTSSEESREDANDKKSAAVLAFASSGSRNSFSEGSHQVSHLIASSEASADGTKPSSSSHSSFAESASSADIFEYSKQISQLASSAESTENDKQPSYLPYTLVVSAADTGTEEVIYPPSAFALGDVPETFAWYHKHLHRVPLLAESSAELPEIIVESHKNSDYASAFAANSFPENYKQSNNIPAAPETLPFTSTDNTKQAVHDASSASESTFPSLASSAGTAVFTSAGTQISNKFSEDTKQFSYTPSAEAAAFSVAGTPGEHVENGKGSTSSAEANVFEGIRTYFGNHKPNMSETSDISKENTKQVTNPPSAASASASFTENNNTHVPISAGASAFASAGANTFPDNDEQAIYFPTSADEDAFASADIEKSLTESTNKHVVDFPASSVEASAFTSKFSENTKQSSNTPTTESSVVSKAGTPDAVVESRNEFTFPSSAEAEASADAFAENHKLGTNSGVSTATADIYTENPSSIAFASAGFDENHKYAMPLPFSAEAFANLFPENNRQPIHWPSSAEASAFASADNSKQAIYPSRMATSASIGSSSSAEAFASANAANLFPENNRQPIHWPSSAEASAFASADNSKQAIYPSRIATIGSSSLNLIAPVEVPTTNQHVHSTDLEKNHFVQSSASASAVSNENVSLNSKYYNSQKALNGLTKSLQTVKAEASSSVGEINHWVGATPQVAGYYVNGQLFPLNNGVQSSIPQLYYTNPVVFVQSKTTSSQEESNYSKQYFAPTNGFYPYVYGTNVKDYANSHSSPTFAATNSQMSSGSHSSSTFAVTNSQISDATPAIHEDVITLNNQAS